MQTNDIVIRESNDATDDAVLLSCALSYAGGHPYDIYLLNNVWMASLPKEEATVIYEFDADIEFVEVIAKYKKLIVCFPDSKLTRMNNKKGEIRWAAIV